MSTIAPSPVPRPDASLLPRPTAPIYTPYYCEENVYNILYALASDPAQAVVPGLGRVVRSHAVFVSNPARRALLFFQRSSKQGSEQGHYVIWDYHVIAVAVVSGKGEAAEAVVVDKDSLLGAKVKLEDYVHMTFQPGAYGDEDEGGIDPSLRSRFRVVPAAAFLANFASDRSHMLLPADTQASSSPHSLRYFQPVPPYEALQGSAAKARGERHNLWTRFLDMGLPAEERSTATGAPSADAGLFGEVVGSVEELLAREW